MTTRRTRWVAGVLLGAALWAADERRAFAQRRCVWDLRGCFYGAAAIDDFWDRWIRGIDCELNFASCLRQELLGR